MKQNKSLTHHDAAASSVDLAGMTVAVVGGTGGIGRALSRFMAARGASIIVVGRTFRDAGLAGIAFIEADLSLMSEAQRIGALLPAERLDLCILTTGIMAGPDREETAEGIERDVAVSYLSRFVIVRAIAARLGRDRRSGARLKPRVFIMGAPGLGHAGTPDDLNAEKSYSRWAVHMNTVAGNEMLVLDAANRYPHSSFFGLNPGFVKTDIRSYFFGGDTFLYRFVERIAGLLTESAETYAARMVPLLVSPDLEGRSGAMLGRKGLAALPSPKLTEWHVRRFMSASEALLARHGVAPTA